MHEIRTEVVIDAPPETVWHTVHEDLKNAPKWTLHLKRAELLDGRRPGPDSVIRYHLDLGGWKGVLEVEHEVWEPPKKCEGIFTDGPIKGSWAYHYRAVKAGTKLVYQMEYELGGMLRFLGGMLRGQYEQGILDTMGRLKEYVETGKVPRAGRGDSSAG